MAIGKPSAPGFNNQVPQPGKGGTGKATMPSTPAQGKVLAEGHIAPAVESRVPMVRESTDMP